MFLWSRERERRVEISYRLVRGYTWVLYLGIGRLLEGGRTGKWME